MTNHPFSIMGWVSSSTNDDYGILNYPPIQISYDIPYQIQGQVETKTWVNWEFPIHKEAVSRSQKTYACHVQN